MTILNVYVDFLIKELDITRWTEKTLAKYLCAIVGLFLLVFPNS